MKQKLVFLAALLTALSTFSAEYFVDAARPDDTGAATNWAAAKKTIQAAVDLTVDGDTVWVTNGVYGAGGKVAPGYSLTNRVCITNATTVRSVNGPSLTVIKGAPGSNGGQDVDSVRGVLMNSSSSLIGFTVTNGYTMKSSSYTLNYAGGGILLMTNCVVSNCVIEGSVSSWGGGACLHQGGTLNSCLLDGNSSVNTGGGVFFYKGGILENCELRGNWADFTGGGASSWFSGIGGVLKNCALNGNRTAAGSGGGMYFGAAYNCTFSENTASSAGGGIYNGTAYNCIFRGNLANRGGGLFDSKAYGCVLYGNSSSYGGGMAYGTANNCTFSSNSSVYSGGGIFFGTIYNSIVWCNVSTNYGVDNLFSTSAKNSCSPSVEHGVNGNITNAPLFVDAANGDFRLLSNSPCINWGNNSYVTNSTDLDGNPRIVEGVVDMGAYEYQGIVGLADSDNDGINDDWERAHGGNQNPNNTCSNGVNTILQAYVAGLDPNDPNSKFLTSVLPGSILQWQPCTSGRVYSVQWSTNLLNGFQPLETNISWTAGCFTDAVHNAYGQLFYKIDVRLEE